MIDAPRATDAPPAPPVDRGSTRFWNPYLAGASLGLVLICAFLLSGSGVGVSGGSSRVGIAIARALAPDHVAATPGFSRVAAEGSSLQNRFVFQLLGVLLGGFVAAVSSGRLVVEVARGPRLPRVRRLVLALLGGALMGFAAKLARGCTSGQALSGGAVLSVGSWLFMLSVFAGGYAVAHVLRRAWR